MESILIALQNLAARPSPLPLLGEGRMRDDKNRILKGDKYK
jgi:hypothetical protein